MALVVLETICVLACGFFLYVLWQWVQEGRSRATRGRTRVDERRWSVERARAKIVSFRGDASKGENRASAESGCRRCERMAHERIARASAAWERV